VVSFNVKQPILAFLKKTKKAPGNLFSVEGIVGRQIFEKVENVERKEGQTMLFSC